MTGAKTRGAVPGGVPGGTAEGSEGARRKSLGQKAGRGSAIVHNGTAEGSISSSRNRIALAQILADQAGRIRALRERMDREGKILASLCEQIAEANRPLFESMAEEAKRITELVEIVRRCSGATGCFPSRIDGAKKGGMEETNGHS